MKLISTRTEFPPLGAGRAGAETARDPGPVYFLSCSQTASMSFRYRSFTSW